MAWRVFGASAMGTSHVETRQPCQDAFARRVEGDVLLAAVCDGAGSCPQSHLGAQTVSTVVIETLAQAAKNLHEWPGEAFQGLVAHSVARAREQLAQLAQASSFEVGVFAATLVGVVAGPERGYFFHLGDGCAVARPRAPEREEIVSLPENGEYANETYFITGADWQAHLRVTPLAEPLATVGLMSDGAAAFVMAKGNRGFHRPFIDPVQQYLDQVGQAEGDQALASTLDDRRTHSITPDDKTLLIARWLATA
jgi:hypothetical protein